MKSLKIAFIFAFIFTFISVNAQEEIVDTTAQDVFVKVDTQPDYTGGDNARLQYLSKAIVYPKEAKENGDQGTVYVTFVVEKDGSITNVKVLRGVSPSLDKSAVNAIEGMPKWTPATLKGEAVRSQYNMPVRYILASGNDDIYEEYIPRKERRALRKKQKAEAKAKANLE